MSRSGVRTTRTPSDPGLLGSNDRYGFHPHATAGNFTSSDSSGYNSQHNFSNGGYTNSRNYRHSISSPATATSARQTVPSTQPLTVGVLSSRGDGQLSRLPGEGSSTAAQSLNSTDEVFTVACSESLEGNVDPYSLNNRNDDDQLNSSLDENAPLLRQAAQRGGHPRRTVSQPVSPATSYSSSRLFSSRLGRTNRHFSADSPPPATTTSLGSSYGSWGETQPSSPTLYMHSPERQPRSDPPFSIGARNRRKPCVTCGGTGHMQKDEEHKLSALVPFKDQRLKPNRTKCYVTIAIILTFITLGMTVFFVYPRQPVLSLCARTKAIYERDRTSMDVFLEVKFNVTNRNFFSVRLVNMSVSMYQVNLTLGTNFIRFTKDNTVAAQHTAMMKHRVNGTFYGDQGRHAVEQCTVNASQNFFLTLNIQLTTEYLAISSQHDIQVPHFFSCLKNTTVTGNQNADQEQLPPVDVPIEIVIVPTTKHRKSSLLRKSTTRNIYQNSCDNPAVTIKPIMTTQSPATSVPV